MQTDFSWRGNKEPVAVAETEKPQSKSRYKDDQTLTFDQYKATISALTSVIIISALEV